LPKAFYWLGPHERLTAERFIKAGFLKGKYQFGVLLWTPEARRVAAKGGKFYEGQAKLLMWKIDMVCETEDEIWVIQVTDIIRDSAISRVLKYKMEYERQYKPTKPVKMGLVAARDNVAFHEMLRQLGIKWWIV